MIFGFSFIGCGSSDSGNGDTCPEPTLDISVCDPDTADFSASTTIDNVFFPLPVGMNLVLEGEEDGETIRLEITVPGDTETVAGVETLVMVETEYEDGELVEVSYNYMAQTDDGTVCYFGEDVDDYEDGEIIGHEGAWLAGVNGAQPGIMMPANPQVGDVFYQEYAEDVAEDMGSVIAMGEAIDVPAGEFEDTLTMEDCNPLEDAETDEKVYVSGIGIAVDADVALISY
jgi:hypothetical protein